MPTYEYECPHHGAFEAMRSMSETRKMLKYLRSPPHAEEGTHIPIFFSSGLEKES